jgi:hypothetical protein
LKKGSAFTEHQTHVESGSYADTATGEQGIVRIEAGETKNDEARTV